MVGLRTQLAIERAGLEPHLKRGAPDFYPSGAGYLRVLGQRATGGA